MSMAKLVTTAFTILTLAYVTPSYLNAEMIKNQVITNITENYVVARWLTDKLSTGCVFYGEASNDLFNQSFSVGEETNHQVILNLLKPGTLYYYFIKAFFLTDSNKRIEVKTPTYTFTTAGIPEAMMLENTVNTVKKDSFTVNWKANVPVKTSFFYIREGDTQKREWTSRQLSLSGLVTIKSLLPSSKYYYFIQFIDGSGKTNNTDVLTVETLENNIALNKKVTGTFTNYLRNDSNFNLTPNMLQRVTDGAVDYFNGLAVSGDIYTSSQYVTIDLGQRISFSRVIPIWRALSYSKSYRISLSSDNKTWVTAASNIDASRDSKTFISGNPVFVNEIVIPPQNARFVRLTADKGFAFNKHAEWTFVQLYEIKILP